VFIELIWLLFPLHIDPWWFAASGHIERNRTLKPLHYTWVGWASALALRHAEVNYAPAALPLLANSRPGGLSWARAVGFTGFQVYS
jgi:hypothetical protein